MNSAVALSKMKLKLLIAYVQTFFEGKKIVQQFQRFSVCHGGGEGRTQ